MFASFGSEVVEVMKKIFDSFCIFERFEVSYRLIYDICKLKILTLNWIMCVKVSQSDVWPAVFCEVRLQVFNHCSQVDPWFGGPKDNLLIHEEHRAEPLLLQDPLKKTHKS